MGCAHTAFEFSLVHNRSQLLPQYWQEHALAVYRAPLFCHRFAERAISTTNACKRTRPRQATCSAKSTRVAHAHCPRYWQEHGLATILVSRLLNLAALLFTVAFSGFLLLAVDWGALRAQCVADNTCNIAQVRSAQVRRFPVAHSRFWLAPVGGQDALP